MKWLNLACRDGRVGTPVLRHDGFIGVFASDFVRHSLASLQ
ncbi:MULTISPECIES: hypothetical protein [Dickeya]|nr:MULTISPECIES: hypothetical protein [Dickeya]